MLRSVLFTILAMMLLLSGAAPGHAQGYTFRPEAQQLKPANNGEPSSTMMAMDAALARPLGLVTTIAGTGAFLVTLPFTLPSGNAEMAARGLVARPFDWTFKRSLGQDDPRYSEKPMR